MKSGRANAETGALPRGGKEPASCGAWRGAWGGRAPRGARQGERVSAGSPEREMEQCWVLQGDGRCRISPKAPQAALGGVADWTDPWGPPPTWQDNGVLGAVRHLLVQGCKGRASLGLGCSLPGSPDARVMGRRQCPLLAEGQGCKRLSINKPGPETGSTGNSLLGGGLE